MKWLLRSVWRATAPLRRPFAAQFETFLSGCLARALESRRGDADLVLDTLLAEQFRIQARLDELQRLLQDQRATTERRPPAV